MTNLLPKWLNEQLVARDWSQNRLGKEAGVSSGEMSRIMNGKLPGVEVALALARALRVPTETILRLAGRIPQAPLSSPEFDEWGELFHQLGDEDRTEMLQIGRLKAGKNDKRKQKQ